MFHRQHREVVIEVVERVKGEFGLRTPLGRSKRNGKSIASACLRSYCRICHSVVMAMVAAQG